ncbi:MAG: DUF480 domain-containing protein [Pirellulaceae bacterium]
MENAQATSTEQSQPKWRPLSSRQRRVLGVLVEKAKTTPDAYPLTLNALVSGCNQKSNRDPQMNLSAELVEETLDTLRGMGAVAEVQGSGRVPKYRHFAYEWLGVDKSEIAVITELLLRGEQTVGELRGRAARMEPIADLAALRPILKSLEQKGLLVSLTPEGRGQVVTHNLYTEKEKESLPQRAAAPADAPPPANSPASSPASTPASDRAASSPAAPSPAPASPLNDVIDQLREELAELRDEVRELQDQMREMRGA